MDGTQPVNPTIEWGPGLGDVVALAAGGRNVRRAEGIYSIAGKVTRPAASALTTTPRHEGTFEFAGVDTHYFISMAIKPGAADLEYHALSLPVAGSTPPISRDYISYDIHYQQPAKAAKFFIGPKHFQTLQKTDPELVRAVWFGMFAFLTVPLLSALNWIHGFVGNYGWSILVLTLLINAAMFPLRHKSFVSMRKMQEIQPQVKAIQDRYAKLKVTDPARQKMNTELMELYRAKGREPGERLHPDAADDAGAARVLQPAVGVDRAARRAVHFLAEGPVGRRSVLRDADLDGHLADGPAEDDADERRRSRAAEDDDDHARRLHVPVHHVAERPGALLAGEQRAADRPAVS